MLKAPTLINEGDLETFDAVDPAANGGAPLAARADDPLARRGAGIWTWRLAVCGRHVACARRLPRTGRLAVHGAVLAGCRRCEPGISDSPPSRAAALVLANVAWVFAYLPSYGHIRKPDFAELFTDFACLLADVTSIFTDTLLADVTSISPTALYSPTSPQCPFGHSTADFTELFTDFAFSAGVTSIFCGCPSTPTSPQYSPSSPQYSPGGLSEDGEERRGGRRRCVSSMSPRSSSHAAPRGAQRLWRPKRGRRAAGQAAVSPRQTGVRDWDLAGWREALIGWAGAEGPLPPLNLLMIVCGEASRTSCVVGGGRRRCSCTRCRCYGYGGSTESGLERRRRWKRWSLFFVGKDKTFCAGTCGTKYPRNYENSASMKGR